MSDIRKQLGSAKEFGTRLPFLSAGKEGTRYGLRLISVNQWEAKKAQNKPGEWRCQFKFEVVAAEGEGATPEKTVVGVLIMEDKEYGLYHFQEFRKVSDAIFGSNGSKYKEDDPETEKLIDKLFAGGFSGTVIAAQFSPNPNEKKAKFPLSTFFAVEPDAEETKTE